MKRQASGTTKSGEPVRARPVLKWAGGKAQLIDRLDAFAPRRYKKYLEPFIGGGAYFFHLNPRLAVIADSNAELINLYRVIASGSDGIGDALDAMLTDSKSFYAIRAQNWTALSQVEAAARTIYLNRLCYNGLFRVNKKGQFNVPYGNYKKPMFPSRQSLKALEPTLKRATIVEGDYLQVLADHAKAGDFVFLDPPYLPIGKYSDFKRYTAAQFHEDDHRELAREVHRLSALGCYVVLTNSNHPLVRELYGGFDIHVVESRRNINSNGALRQGQDLIVVARPQ